MFRISLTFLTFQVMTMSISDPKLTCKAQNHLWLDHRSKSIRSVIRNMGPRFYFVEIRSGFFQKSEPHTICGISDQNLHHGPAKLQDQHKDPDPDFWPRMLKNAREKLLISTKHLWKLFQQCQISTAYYFRHRFKAANEVWIWTHFHKTSTIFMTRKVS